MRRLLREIAGGDVTTLEDLPVLEKFTFFERCAFIAGRDACAPVGT